MMAYLKHIFARRARPITHRSVTPAPRDTEKEDLIRQHRAQTAMAVVDGERASWQIRQELAGNILKIVSGDRA